MSANRIQIKTTTAKKKITIPIGQAFDGLGREQLINIYEEVEQQDHINLPQDYETTQYAHDNPNDDYNMFYKFRFFNTGTTVYDDSYQTLGFTTRDLATNKKSFINSFIKLDFFDSPLRNKQKIMFSMIIPSNNSIKDYMVPVDPVTDPIEYFSQISNGAVAPNVFWKQGVYEPQMRLGPNIGKNEGYYIQWLKERTLFELNTFYVGCKFFDAKNGKVVRMINQPNNPPTTGVYDYLDYFYYQLVLDIKTNNTLPKYNYKFRQFNRFLWDNDMTGSPKGTQLAPVMFYEYINPQ